MKLSWFVMLLLILGLQFRLWVGEGSFSEARFLQQKVETLVEANEKLSQRNNKLDAEVTDLKSGVDAIEERARNELGMIGPNETFFLVVSKTH